MQHIIRIARALVRFTKLVLCPVCGINQVEEGYVCADCSAEVRR